MEVLFVDLGSSLFNTGREAETPAIHHALGYTEGGLAQGNDQGEVRALSWIMITQLI
jgi:hypothetical protein